MSLNLESKYKNIGLEEYLDTISGNSWYWIAKRLSGNDTGITGGHQVGIYYPKRFFEVNFKEICTFERKNPDSFIDQVYFPNDDYLCESVRAIYYNNKFTEDKTRDEFRITSWGGQSAPIQQHENTGALFVFALFKEGNKNHGLGWVAANSSEEEKIEEWIGTEVFPGEFRDRDNLNFNVVGNLKNLIKLIPLEWYKEFPGGYDIFSLIEKYIPWTRYKDDIDKLLLERRRQEFSLFRHLESEYVQPIIDKGFATIDDFIWQANSITNRRKSRTGKSLEHNLTSIFISEGIKFDAQSVTENRKRPDFIFPSGNHYHNPDFAIDKLDMLGAKTCCKDRWRQILSEADKIKVKHLFTLQEGTSTQQLKEMESSNVQLVIPQLNKTCFPKEWRNKILSLREFVDYRKEIDKIL